MLSLPKVLMMLMLVGALMLSGTLGGFDAPVYGADKNNNGTTKTCVGNQQCGWAVYNRDTREIEYFMKNTCDCEKGLECIRVSESISVFAFVYRCRKVPTTTTNSTDSDS